MISDISCNRDVKEGTGLRGNYWKDARYKGKEILSENTLFELNSECLYKIRHN